LLRKYWDPSFWIPHLLRFFLRSVWSQPACLKCLDACGFWIFESGLTLLRVNDN
jgi:hypothetical protein